MRIAIFTPPDTVGQRTPAELVQLAERAEQSGLAGLWLVQLATSGQDVLTTLALAGQRTSRLELGTAVIPIYGRHPLMLAQQAATTQAVTGGRLTLGLGLSHQPVVEGVLGLSYAQPARHMREYLTVMRRLLNGERVDHTGPAFSVHATLTVPGAAAGPLLIAALAPRMLEIAGELAEGTITWMAGRQTIARHIVPRINHAAEAAGRPSR
jgi:5,10-methylenetetrahydromethanopterin reductase